jgi:hypothetical protein
MRSSTPSLRHSFVRALIATAALAVAASAQSPAPKPAPASPQTPASNKQTTPAKTDAQNGAPQQPGWKLRVSKETPTMLSLKAKDAQLKEIAAELSRKLKTPVVLSPLMQKQFVTLDFSDVPLEGALRMLAPLPYVDYEIGGDGSAQPRPLAIFLYAFNEQPPARDAVLKGNDEAILISGNTEEGTEEYEKKREKEELPLIVKFDKNLLTVKAKQQPLAVIVAEIANKVDIPFEMKYESTDLVDVNFSNYTMEQAARALSPNVRLYQRVNLSTYESTPLRLALVPPAGATNTN